MPVPQLHGGSERHHRYRTGFQFCIPEKAIHRAGGKVDPLYFRFQELDAPEEPAQGTNFIRWSEVACCRLVQRRCEEWKVFGAERSCFHSSSFQLVVISNFPPVIISR